jgi:site-specific recombinase XerD
MVRMYPSSQINAFRRHKTITDNPDPVQRYSLRESTPRTTMSRDSSGVEHAHGKGGVVSSNLILGSIFNGQKFVVSMCIGRSSTFYFFNLLLMHSQNVKVQDLLNRYLQYCEVMRNYSPYTITGYRVSWELFLRETGIEHVEQLTKPVFQDWFFKGRLERKWSASTFRSYLKYFNMMSKWLVKEGYMETNPVADIEKPKMEKRIPRTLTRAEAILVLDSAFHMKYAYRFEKYRNRALVGVMLLSGLRRKEALCLKLQDVDLKNRSIFIQQGKGAKDRVVPMNARLCDILKDYLVERSRLEKETLYFFTAVQRDQQLGVKAINNLMLRLRRKTRLNFSAHTLRHAFARLMLEGGCDIYTLSKIMGHTKITTTTIYLSCSSQQMSKAVEGHVLN